MNLFWFFRKHEDDDTVDAGLNEELRGSRLLLWTSFAALVIFGLWAYFAELDQITRAPGSVIPSSRIQVLQSENGGMLEALLVHEGDIVRAGQEVARIEPTRAKTEYLESQARAAALEATVDRLKAEIFGGSPKFRNGFGDYPEFRRNELALLKKRRSSIEAEIGAMGKILALIRKELKMNRPLARMGDISQTDILRLERQEAELSAQITNRRNQYFREAQEELNKADEELKRVVQLLTQRKRQFDQTVLSAPVDGVVKNVYITTLGGVFRAGDEVMQIVPIEDDLLIEAKVTPADIGFLHPGQQGKVKIDAYDFSIYGGLDGELTYISADTLQERTPQGEVPYYRIHVRTSGRKLTDKQGKVLEIQPGMTATVEIKTGSRTVLNYIFKPIVKTLSESLGER